MLELTLYTIDHPKSTGREMILNLILEGGVKLHLRMGTETYRKVCAAMLLRETINGSASNGGALNERERLALLQLKYRQHQLDYDIVQRLQCKGYVNDNFELTELGVAACST